MVLTVRPAWAGNSDDPGHSRTAERLAMRRVAIPLFVERGYDAVTVDDLTSAAGVSRRTFFRIFGGKHQIVSCDHEVFHLEMHTHLLQHQAERTIGRASRSVALLIDGLTIVPEDASTRARLLASNGGLQTEESRWFARHQTMLATFLTDHAATQTTIKAEMAAASIIAAARIAIRDFLDNPGIPANARFEEATRSLTAAQGGGARQLAIVETSLPLDELLARINDVDR